MCLYTYTSRCNAGLGLKGPYLAHTDVKSFLSPSSICNSLAIMNEIYYNNRVSFVKLMIELASF